MSEVPTTTIELIIKPEGKQTVDEIEGELEAYVQDVLREAGEQHLIDNGELRIEVEEGTPDPTIVAAIIAIVGAFALETYKELILPKLKKRYKIIDEKERKGKSKKDKGSKGNSKKSKKSKDKD